MIQKPLSAVAIVLLFLLLPGCSGESSPQQAAPQKASSTINVYVVNYPLQYFADRIGGNHVQVTFPGPPDQDPGSWRPDSQAIADYQGADLILLNGAGYAKWIDTATLPQSKLVDTSAPLADQLIDIAGAVTHAHGPDARQANTGAAFTTWIDPRWATEQADAIRAALTKLRPDLESELQTGYDQLQKDLRDLDSLLAAATEGKPDRSVVFSRDVYQYLSRRYEIDGRTLTLEPQTPLSDKQLGELKRLLAAHAADVLVWAAEPLPENVARVKELGLRSVVFDPCGNVPAEGDYLTVMRANAERLAGAL